jgi:hypothetical protein
VALELDEALGFGEALELRKDLGADERSKPEAVGEEEASVVGFVVAVDERNMPEAVVEEEEEVLVVGFVVAVAPGFGSQFAGELRIPLGLFFGCFFGFG